MIMVCIVTCCKIKVSLCKIHKHVIPATIFLFFSICMKSFLFGVICNSNRTNVFGQKSCLSSISPTVFSLQFFKVICGFRNPIQAPSDTVFAHRTHFPSSAVGYANCWLSTRFLRLNIMNSPGCNAWRDEPMCVCRNDRCVDAK